MSKYFTKNNDNKIPPLQINNNILVKNHDKAEAFANHYEKVHYLRDKLGLDDHNKLVNSLVLNYHNINHTLNLDTIKYDSPAEISKAIKHFKPKKAPGLDGIQNILLKNLPIKAIVYLTNIFNCALKNSYFPENC